ncbi:hypothetical protein [Amycolatopsis sp. NPDC051102]|uniref:hypothetical protein n=1 Tax=Amycolatopsis sp. NPDC051102 TaxID=3155163 RepID=UPI0034139156
MRKRMQPSRPEREAGPAPDTSIAAMPAAVLRLQRAAGNRAVTGMLPIQRYRSQNVPADDVAEQTRHGGDDALSEKNLAVAYVAEQGSQEAKAETPVWSSGTRDPEVHAERIAVRQAQAGGARLEYHPRDDEAKRIVRVYTELEPCGPCSNWLYERLHEGVVVQWTAPPHSATRWQAFIPNALWRTRVILLAELYALRRQAATPDAVAAVSQARSSIVSVVLSVSEWERHGGEKKAMEAATNIDADWRRQVVAARDVVRPPVPVNVPPVLAGPVQQPVVPAGPVQQPVVPAGPVQQPVVPAAPVRPGTLDSWLTGTNAPAVLTKKPAAPVFKGGGPAPAIKKAAKAEAICEDCGKRVTVNKTGRLHAHKNPQEKPCRGSRYKLL